MPTDSPQTVIIRGKRFTSTQELEDNPRAMREAAQELIDCADFQLTCLPKIIRYIQQPQLDTEKVYGDTDGIWTKILLVISIDEQSSGRAEEIIV